MHVTLSRQTLASVAQLLGSLRSEDASVLLYKHLGLQLDHMHGGVSGYVEALVRSEPDAIMELVKELARESRAIRATTPTKYVFDGHYRTLLRWLLHDGWNIDNGQLVRLAPAAEQASGVRDALIEQLECSGLDNDGGIRKRIEDASQAFIREPPDFNGSTVNVRIALETIVRAAAANRAARGVAPYTKDVWGCALSYLRQAGVLDSPEEEVLARIYTFISPGAHVPTGITEEEWARLARTFGLGAAYFVLKKHLGQP